VLNEVARSSTFDGALRAIRDTEVRDDLVGLITGAIADVERDDADIILLAARRMTCLYALMQKEGLEPPRSEGRDILVVSDRFIELLPDGAWAGKRVILLDDTTVTGFTIQHRTDRTRRLVGDTGTISPRVALNLKNSSRFRKPRIDSLDLHNQFARAFGTNLVPFFTDFAISREIEIRPALLDRMLANREWRTVDVTNQVLAGTGARAFSLFPSAAFATRLADALGDVSRLIETTKIRMFVDDDFGQLRMRIVPIVLTHALDEKSVKAWLKAVGVESNGSPEQSAHAAGLITMMLSRELLRVFAKFAFEEFDLLVDEDLGLSALALGRLADGETNNRLDTLATLSADVGGGTQLRADPYFTWPGGIAEDGSHYTIVGDDAVLDGYRDLVRIRGKGKQTTTLKQIAAESGSNVTASSIAIDVLNDLGYSVPVFSVSQGKVFRAYRPGESVRDLANLVPGRMGGKLATLAHTKQIPDEVYFGEEILLDSRGLR
jgi:hypothetical protein